MTPESTREQRARFEDSEALRALLNRLHEAGTGAWRHDPEAALLMRHAADKYAALAKKHGLDPWEAASAAFEAMRGAATRRADDPWAVVTRAVQVTCIGEERGDRENPLPDYHPAFHIAPFADTDEEQDGDEVVPERTVNVTVAVEDTIALLSWVGWEPVTARAAVEYITGRLAESVSRASAFETLRRDRQARALLDIPGSSWTTLLRIVLGHPDPALSGTNTGRGLLLRLLNGEPLRALLRDDDLVLTAGLAAPDTGGDLP
ncbi:hypothetical protein [Microbacterium tenebrionis]|uniref:hypothetical protein n=1 Tax=Microbacterium tenebrionis TaxID=2830665 RepID=UPI00158F4004|nr:hypothetical protein [Microbacterium ihumii]